MSSRYNYTEAWQEKLEQLQNELTLAQYEAENWKKKYLVEKRRRQKMARELLDHVVRLERHSHGMKVDAGPDESSLSPFSNSIDNTATLLSPTLSSFDFDDDSSEDSSEELLNGPVLSSKLSPSEESDALVNEKDGKSNMLLSPSTVFELRDRHSLLYHSAPSMPSKGRYNRSLTAGSAVEAFRRSSERVVNGKENIGHENSQLQPPHLMYHMMQPPPSSCDLWHARVRPNKLPTVARSFLLSSHKLKTEHMFERFFITGMTLSESECQQPASELAGYWKPKLLYEFPNKLSESLDESVADFCYPKGVPLVVCTPDQAASLRGVPVSKWFTAIEPLEQHLKAGVETSGYTFRLTGAKGQVLYGFCAAIMTEVIAAPSSRGGKSAGSWSSEPARTLMAPMCYCFTSKFPFYRFHFAMLRMIIENELIEQRVQAEDEVGKEEDEEYEIILSPLLDLAVEFKPFHEESSSRLQETRETTTDPTHLTSIATKLALSPVNDHVILREDASVSITSEDDESARKPTSKRQPSPFRKSFSTDDMGLLYTGISNEWLVGKPMVKSIEHLNQPKQYERIKIGDVLEAIDGIATASMSFEQTLSLLEKSVRPLRLCFRRPNGTQETSVGGSKSQRHLRCLSTTSIDILHGARRIKLNEPGQWSTARFPTFTFMYQFPTRPSDRWAVGVVLRFLTPEKVVETLANLLLEKQVVIMSDSPAKISAVCTALLLLLAPFQWQSTYIPLLPATLLDFLHSPVPFLVGCHSLQETSEWPDVCFYDIDQDVMVMPSEAHRFVPSSIPNGIELGRLLRKAQERYRLVSTSAPKSKPWYELSDEQDTILTLTLQEAEIFLRDLALDIPCDDLFSKGGSSFYDRVQEQVAKEGRKSLYDDFWDAFTQTQLFYQYYEGLLHPETQQ